MTPEPSRRIGQSPLDVSVQEKVALWAEEVALRAARLRAELGRGVSVGISGVDCAGKSTLAEALCGRLADAEVAVVLLEGDEFTRPTHERYGPDEGLAYYRDSFDYREVFDNVLPAVRNSFHGDLEIRVTDWERDGWQVRRLTVPQDAVVVVEGCFLFAGNAAHSFDLSVWLELPVEHIVARAVRRPRDFQRMGGIEGQVQHEIPPRPAIAPAARQA